MTVFKKQITIDIPKQRVWEIVADLGSIYRFHPGVRKSYYTTDVTEGIGAARICELQPAGKILETVKYWKIESGFLLQIDPIEKAPPVKNFTGNFQLRKLDERRTEVALTINYDMKLGAIGRLLNKLIIRSKMEEGIVGLLEGLKVYSEKGVEVKDEKTLQNLLRTA